jgi:hypothetical protein
MMSAWVASAGHYSNLINADYTSVGVACLASALEDSSRAAEGGPPGGMLCSQVFQG